MVFCQVNAVKIPLSNVGNAIQLYGRVYRKTRLPRLVKPTLEHLVKKAMYPPKPFQMR